MKHVNPYRINDPDDIFEVGENSSHPELADARRVWKFGGYTFKNATELKKFFEAEGLNPRHYWIEPVLHRDHAKNMVVISVIEKWKSRSKRKLRELSFGQNG